MQHLSPVELSCVKNQTEDLVQIKRKLAKTTYKTNESRSGSEARKRITHIDQNELNRLNTYEL